MKTFYRICFDSMLLDNPPSPEIFIQPLFIFLWTYICMTASMNNIFIILNNMNGNTVSSLLQQLASTLYLWDSYIWVFSLLLMNSILLFENIIFHAEYLGDFSPSFCNKCCYKFSSTNFLAHICKKFTGAYTKEWNCWFMTHIYILSFTTCHQIVLQCRYPRLCPTTSNENSH